MYNLVYFIVQLSFSIDVIDWGHNLFVLITAVFVLVEDVGVLASFVLKLGLEDWAVLLILVGNLCRSHQL